MAEPSLLEDDLFSSVFPAPVPLSQGAQFLAGCVEKVRRARDNIQVLDGEIGRFFATRPYYPVLGDGWLKLGNGQVTQGVVFGKKPRRIRLAVLREPPHAQWSVLVGEIVHDLRSALDQLVFGLSVTKSGSPPNPIPRKDRWKDVGFPIVTREVDWSSRCTGALWAVSPPRLRASFRSLQPFYRRKRPERHPLAVLHELWNGDKHRSLHFLSTLGGIHELSPQRDDFFTSEAPFGAQLIRRRVVGPLEHGADLGSISFGGPYYGNQQDYVDMHLQFAFDIAFDQGSPAFGGRLMPTLQRLDKAVSMIVAKYEPHLR